MLPITPTLDFALSVVCLVLAWFAARSSNDFLTAGFLWVAGAAFLGGLRFAGIDEVKPTHSFLSDVAEGPGMFSLAIGLLASWYGPWSFSRSLAPALSVAGVALVHHLEANPSTQVGNIMLGLSSCLLLALLCGAFLGFRSGRLHQVLYATGAIASLLFVAFGMQRVSIPNNIPLQRVDLVHILLMVAYVLVWLSASAKSSR